MAVVEQEVLWGRRAFPAAQTLLGGSTLRRWGNAVGTGWHDTQAHPETGAFALVRAGAGLDDLIGEVLGVGVGDRRVFVYCLATGDVPTDLSLTRRAFAGLGLLSLESLACTVDVIA